MTANRTLPAVMTALLIAAAVTLGCAGCGGGKSATKKPAFVQTELYLGLDVPAGGIVSEEQFAAFLDEVVTREFPAGLTVYDAYGQMQQADGFIVRQKTRVVLLVHEDTKANTEAVSGVISEYRSRFGNPQVMHTRQAVEPEFFGN